MIANFVYELGDGRVAPVSDVSSRSNTWRRTFFASDCVMLAGSYALSRTKPCKSACRATFRGVMIRNDALHGGQTFQFYPRSDTASQFRVFSSQLWVPDRVELEFQHEDGPTSIDDSLDVILAQRADSFFVSHAPFQSLPDALHVTPQFMFEHGEKEIFFGLEVRIVSTTRVTGFSSQYRQSEPPRNRRAQRSRAPLEEACFW